MKPMAEKYIRVSTAKGVVLTGGCGECKLRRSEECKGCRTQAILDLLDEVEETIGEEILDKSYRVDRNGREIMRGDRVTGLFHNGHSITGICEFSRKHSAWGIRWNRGGVAEFTPFCCTCNVEWEVQG